MPAHLYETIAAAYRHKGFSFVRILQRCPAFTPDIFDEAVRNPDRVEVLTHPNGIVVPDLDQIYKNQLYHDPADLDDARRLTEPGERIRVGLFFQNESRPRYDDVRRQRIHTAQEKIDLLNREFDRYAV